MEPDVDTSEGLKSFGFDFPSVVPPTSGLSVTPKSRQMIYLPEFRAEVSAGKFIEEQASGQSDRDIPSDMVNGQPPVDGRIASAGNPFASKLDGIQDESGNPWKAMAVQSGQAIPFSLTFDRQVKIRRVRVFITKADWDSGQSLSRRSFDLFNPLYSRTCSAAPYWEANGEVPEGLIAPSPFEFSLNLPVRSVGRHTLLLEIDYPDNGDALYQVFDLQYTT
ncbi:lytic polysaccharide monooxygenase [Streptomyces sp. AP-93]|uniref:lytic polysaccharide monooxygenase n=1 Tax=Streptomyces sp. AP-93 TaxID=2929048 RepID=UPI001FAF1D72|nr:lytic polysaccharide monooxygenase [Streptomyces sp. AP-93]MCJ0875187.1 lytic polysaccharide monooxygenase [Streptomyces sp. AP-93]